MRTPWQRRRLGGSPFEALESRNLLSVSPQLLADINTQSSSYPHDFIEFDGRLVYTAYHPDYGRELWSSDGTEAGTQLIKDIDPGTSSSSVSELVVVGDWLYFIADDGTHGDELWRTDGTAEGTTMVLDIRPGTSSSFGFNSELVNVAGTLLFTANNGTTGTALWKSDGTTLGTVLVKDLNPSTSTSDMATDLTAVGSTLYFLGNDGTTGFELWKSDGTAEGTTLVKDIRPGSSSSSADYLTSFQDAIYFIASDNGAADSLWRSNGTAEGTVPVVGTPGYTLQTRSAPVAAGEKLFFAADAAGQGTELWVIESATPTSASLVGDLNPGASGSAPRQLFAIDDLLYFSANKNDVYGLWKSDGTLAGTTQLAALESNGSVVAINSLANYGGELYFSTFDGTHAADLWRSNGTSLGTYPWRALIAPAGTSVSVQLAVAGGQLFYNGNGGAGVELWRTDGTFAGTRLVKDIADTATDSSSPEQFVSAGSHVFFVANDGSGSQLYSAAGPNGPVTQLTPSAYGVQSSQVAYLTPVGDLLYFTADDAFGERYLGVSDGTPQGTRRLDWPHDADEPAILGLHAFAGGVIFLAYDATLGVMVCRADENGIVVVQTLGQSLPYPGVESLVWQGQYYFTAYVDGTYDLWLSDGTAEGTRRFIQIVPNVFSPRYLTATDSAVYFVTGNQLWKTNGTAEGTQSLILQSFPRSLMAAGDTFYFTAFGGPPGAPSGTIPLWTTDMTQVGTKFVTHIYDTNTGSFPQPSGRALGGKLYYFAPATAQFGSPVSLWGTDGTPAGTSRLQVLPGSASFFNNACQMTVENNELFVLADRNLYQSDGTAQGTRHLFYSQSLFQPFAPLSDLLTTLDGTLYLALGAEGVGSEPFTYTPEAATVVGRHLFYNQSKFDGGLPAIDRNVLANLDDAAIAPDKTAYLPGSGVVTFQNISSYSRGINGVTIDVANMPANVALEDFQFRVGTGNNLNTWTAAPAPTDFFARAGLPSESGDVTRVAFAWASGAIANTWLEITILANPRTGLVQPEVFYFGSRIGDSGTGSPTAAVTSAADELAARFAPGANQSITSLLDFDRNGVVSAGDALIARNNGGVLLKLNLPAPEAAVPLVLAEPQRASAAARSPSRGELLAYAMRSWNELLDAEGEDELIGVRWWAPQ